MFIGRELELDDLNNRLVSDKFEMVPIYGRRRVGKTRLLEQFVEGKKSIFFTATMVSERMNLERLSRAIFDYEDNGDNSATFPDYEAAFTQVARYAKKESEPIIFIIDEYPYLAKSSEGISSVLQKVIDYEYLNLNNLMLILTGSQMSFMEKQVLGYESPLYGRRTGQIKLQPFSFHESCALLGNFTKEEQLTLHGITGGIPLYLTMIDNKLSLRENITKNILRVNTFLYEEPYNLLLQELRTPNNYNDVIVAVASGATEIKDISGKTKLDSSQITKLLNVLIDLNIIEKCYPLGNVGKKKGIYQVCDGLFRFWYRVVPKYLSYIESNRIELVWDYIKEDLPRFTSLEFERLCRRWIMEQLGTESLPFLVSEVGAWWGNNPLIKAKGANAEEIDVIALGLQSTDVIIGECKWRERRTDVNVGMELVRKSMFFPQENKALFIFSKAGFTDSLIDYATENKIKLVQFIDM